MNKLGFLIFGKAETDQKYEETDQTFKKSNQQIGIF